jgi:hypothetical protein
VKATCRQKSFLFLLLFLLLLLLSFTFSFILFLLSSLPFQASFVSYKNCWFNQIIGRCFDNSDNYDVPLHFALREEQFYKEKIFPR